MTRLACSGDRPTAAARQRIVGTPIQHLNAYAVDPFVFDFQYRAVKEFNGHLLDRETDRFGCGVEPPVADGTVSSPAARRKEVGRRVVVKVRHCSTSREFSRQARTRIAVATLAGSAIRRRCNSGYQTRNAKATANAPAKMTAPIARFNVLSMHHYAPIPAAVPALFGLALKRPAAGRVKGQACRSRPAGRSTQQHPAQAVARPRRDRAPRPCQRRACDQEPGGRSCQPGRGVRPRHRPQTKGRA